MTRCLLCGKDHEPGKHDFSGLGSAVAEHAAERFATRPAIEILREREQPRQKRKYTRRAK